VVKRRLRSAGDASALPPQRARKRALGAPGLTASLLPQVSRCSQSSRLVSGAPRRPRCDAGVSLCRHRCERGCSSPTPSRRRWPSQFHIADGADFIQRAPNGHFDLIYADAWPGKFSHLEPALALLRPGGIYLIDDLLPQANWPEGHAPKVPLLIEDLERRSEFASVKLAWASGVMVVVRRTAG
jgi:hypothetical protein